MVDVLHVPAFKDNYIWLIRGTAPNKVAVVDPGDAEPVLAFCATHGLEPGAILCTHHHHDHVGGIEDLHARFRLPVYGPTAERIPACSHPVSGDDVVDLPGLGLMFRVLAVPGHTRGHIAYYGHGLLFCGDTLFSAGCGRLFEGTAEQMHSSLGKLLALPPDTAVYCAHEYTADGLRFAAAVEPQNSDVRAHQRQVATWRAMNRPSLPSTIGLERRINPFLRCDQPDVRAAATRIAGQPLDSEASVFAVIRRWKDGFRG
ncbi:MAG: hydroxyacylglutathione hydrolase [Pseudomonadota bacterium]|nr:MAG: hydroxyacylglutathione hydrolase [Pseudomonadota bacterium]